MEAITHKIKMAATIMSNVLQSERCIRIERIGLNTTATTPNIQTHTVLPARNEVRARYSPIAQTVNRKRT
ncbi:hypothetical protein ACPOL_0321 [Acidisarcina polymorpha]|uniref:Uncharacterized protein n=1 Tax=Acidisarcina polymorpha TaxID=2211140 RepID=A0A2Z5FT83_9BACT|nr:hypothetical protein ACPOL_0321 [Acidisarcina polymorpha]